MNLKQSPITTYSKIRAAQIKFTLAIAVELLDMSMLILGLRFGCQTYSWSPRDTPY